MTLAVSMAAVVMLTAVAVAVAIMASREHHRRSNEWRAAGSCGVTQ